MSRHSRWPVRVKRGNSTVTIYKAERKKNGHLYREFKLAYYNEIGKRTFQSFNSFKKARKAADNVNVSLMKGEVKSLVLSNEKPSGARSTWKIWSIGWADSPKLFRRALP